MTFAQIICILFMGLYTFLILVAAVILDNKNKLLKNEVEQMENKIITNPDVKYVQGIIKGLIAKGGHCPCQVGKTEDNLCPCKPFREEQYCCCKLYIKNEVK